METSKSFDQSAAGEQGKSTVMQQAQEPMKVLVAIDDSEESFYALKWTLDNLFPSAAVPSTEPADQTRILGVLHLLNVQQPFQHYMFPAGSPFVYPTTSVIDSAMKAQEQNSTCVLSGALQICKQRPVIVETLMTEGDPKDMICQAAEQMHSDLLVVGSRGHGQIKRAFLGSVSDYCAHHAQCPVLIVKPRQ